MAIDKVVSASITDSAVTSTKVAAGVLHPNFKNLFKVIVPPSEEEMLGFKTL